MTMPVPAPEFVAHLEWQLRTALRRESRFARPARLSARERVRAPASLVMAVTFGACGLLAAQSYQRNRAGELLAIQYQLRMEIAQRREQAALEDVAELSRAVEQGLAPPAEWYAAEERRLALAIEAGSLGLDAIEVARTGHEPDRRLSAPLVDGKDLVTERLRIELEQHGLRLSATRARERVLATQRAAGVIAEGDLDAVRSLRERLERREALLRTEIDLRERHLRGEIAAPRVDLMALSEEAAIAVADARQDLARAERERDHVQALRAAGVVGERDAKLAARGAEEGARRVQLALLEQQTIAARLGE